MAFVRDDGEAVVTLRWGRIHHTNSTWSEEPSRSFDALLEVDSLPTLYWLVGCFKGRVSTDIGNMELWARGWRIYFSELTVSFKPQGKFFNSLYFEHPRAKSAITYYRLHPNTFHNTINKNVNHSNDTIDNLNQSRFHKPACQCQGHLRTESLSASAHILHCGKIRPWVVRSGFRCASADLRQSRYLRVAR